MILSSSLWVIGTIVGLELNAATTPSSWFSTECRCASSLSTTIANHVTDVSFGIFFPYLCCFVFMLSMLFCFYAGPQTRFPGPDVFAGHELNTSLPQASVHFPPEYVVVTVVWYRQPELQPGR